MKEDSEMASVLGRVEVLMDKQMLTDSRPGGERKTYKNTIPAQLRNGLVVGTLTGFGESCVPLVQFPENISAAPVPARSTVELTTDQIGCEVALLFERGDFASPIVIGCLRNSRAVKGGQIEIAVDGEKLIFSAKREIVLRCGKASITLTEAGKILICGAYLLNRSSGLNRIKGGSVQIN